MRKLTFVSFLVLSIILSGCASVLNSERGEKFFKGDTWDESKEQILSWVENGIGKISEEEAYARLGLPMQEQEDRFLRVKGWFFVENSVKKINIGVYKRISGYEKQRILALVFNKKGILMDFETRITNIPSSSNMFSSEILIQIAIFDYTLQRLDNMLSDVLDRSLEKFRLKVHGDIKNVGANIGANIEGISQDDIDGILGSTLKK